MYTLFTHSILYTHLITLHDNKHIFHPVPKILILKLLSQNFKVQPLRPRTPSKIISFLLRCFPFLTKFTYKTWFSFYSCVLPN